MKKTGVLFVKLSIWRIGTNDVSYIPSLPHGSVIWNNLLKIMNLLKKGLCWRVGNEKGLIFGKTNGKIVLCCPLFIFFGSNGIVHKIEWQAITWLYKVEWFYA